MIPLIVSLHIQESKTVVHREKFEDFSENCYKVTIARVQQAALKQIGGKLPTPSEQLAMVNKRREKKKTRSAQATHVLSKFWS